MSSKTTIWILGVISIFLFFSTFLNHLVQAHYSAIIHLVNHYPQLARISFIFIFSTAICIGVPNPSFLFIGGLLFGIQEGFCLGIIANSIAITLCFFSSRLLGKRFRQFIEKKISLLVSFIMPYDWRMILALRLNPVIPTTLVNYYFGLTRIRFWFYGIISLIASAPFGLAYASLGTLANKLITPPLDGQLRYSLIALCVVIGLGSFYYIGRRFSQKPAEAVQTSQQFSF